jgi:hypothetical protein
MAYVGPVVMLTLQEAEALLPAAPTSPAEQSAAHKIQAALASSPIWRKPLT